jgi:hypothetical protein
MVLWGAAVRHQLLATALVSAVLGVGAVPRAFAQATSPATTSQGSFNARITAIKGTARVRSGPDAQWELAKVGMVLEEGAELTTNVKSAVQFVIPPDQTITLDRLGVLQILRSSFENGKIVTDLGMKYGRVHYDIDAQGVQHDAKVHSPSSVLAIRGTRVILYDQPPFTPQAVSLTGRAFFRDVHKEIAFGGPGAGTTKIDQDNQTPANTALQQATADPRGKFSGRTQTDNILQQSLAAYGGADFSNLGVLSLFAAARNGTFKGSFTGALPIGRQLAFSLFWTGAAGSDVDLIITSPLGEVVSPTITSVPSGGQHLGNGVATSDGFGQEQVVWPISYPVGTYKVSAQLKTGQRAQAEIFAIDDPLGIGQVIGDIPGTLTTANPILTGTVDATGKVQTPQQQGKIKQQTAAAVVTTSSAMKQAKKPSVTAAKGTPPGPLPRAVGAKR